MNYMFMRIKKFLLALSKRIIQFRGTPEQLSWGMAVGFFVAMTPTMGIQTYIVIPLAALLGISKITAATGVWITNPLTAPFIYGFNYLIGAMLLGYPAEITVFSSPSRETLFSSGKQVFMALAVGGTITGIIAGAAGYFVTLGLIKSARAARYKRKGKVRTKEEL